MGVWITFINSHQNWNFYRCGSPGTYLWFTCKSGRELLRFSCWVFLWFCILELAFWLCCFAASSYFMILRSPMKSLFSIKRFSLSSRDIGSTAPLYAFLTLRKREWVDSSHLLMRVCKSINCLLAKASDSISTLESRLSRVFVFSYYITN